MSDITPPNEDRGMEYVGHIIEEMVPGGMVTKFVLMGEVVQEDGSLMFFSTTSPDMRAWDCLGLMQLGLVREQARLTADMIEGEDS